MGTASIQRGGQVHRTRAGASGAIEQLLLLSGALAALVYFTADAVASLSYPGYRALDQAISELSAVGAATSALWGKFMPVYGILMGAFAIGVVRLPRATRPLRTAGVMLLVFTLSGVLWSLVPMHQRGAVMTWQDQGHILMGIYSVLMLSAIIGVAAFSLGTRFQLFSVVAGLVVLLTGAWSFVFAERLAAGQPTPWLGLIERVSVHGFMAWNAVFALTLAARARWGTSSG
jgi:hypothetical protein